MHIVEVRSGEGAAHKKLEARAGDLVLARGRT